MRIESRALHHYTLYSEIEFVLSFTAIYLPLIEGSKIIPSKFFIKHFYQ